VRTSGILPVIFACEEEQIGRLDDAGDIYARIVATVILQ
jgi:hypothetical protein